MRWLPALGMAMIGMSAFAQWPDPPEPDTTPPPSTLQLNLPGMLNSPANYKGYLPRGDVNYELQNLGEQSATLWIAIVEEDGTRQLRHIDLGSGEAFEVHADSAFERAEVHLLSLQPFRITTETPIETVGPPSRHVPVTPATKPLRDLRTMETASGASITVAIDRQGRCHYPIYGRIIGRLGEDGRVLLENGRRLDPITR